MVGQTDEEVNTDAAKEPNEHLPVKGAGQAVQAGGEGKEGVTEGGTNQLASVGRDVATLMVAVDGDVKPHELIEALVVPESKKVGKVLGVVGIGVNGGNLAISINVAEDATSDVWQLSNEVHRVLEGRSPVILLADTLSVSLGKGRVVIQL